MSPYSVKAHSSQALVFCENDNLTLLIFKYCVYFNLFI